MLDIKIKLHFCGDWRPKLDRHLWDCGNWTSVAVARGLLMPFYGLCFSDGGGTKESTFSRKPTWLMVATFVAICCFDEICRMGRWYSYSVRLRIIVVSKHYTPSTAFIDTPHAPHAEDQTQPDRSSALANEVNPEDVTRTFSGWLWSWVGIGPALQWVM